MCSTRDCLLTLLSNSVSDLYVTDRTMVSYISRLRRSSRKHGSVIIQCNKTCLVCQGVATRIVPNPY